jgi:hypothetical protein
MKRYHYHSLILAILFLLLGLLSSLVVTRVRAVAEKRAAQMQETNEGRAIDLLLDHAAAPAFAALARPESIAPLSLAGLTFTRGADD